MSRLQFPSKFFHLITATSRALLSVFERVHILASTPRGCRPVVSRLISNFSFNRQRDKNYIIRDRYIRVRFPLGATCPLIRYTFRSIVFSFCFRLYSLFLLSPLLSLFLSFSVSFFPSHARTYLLRLSFGSSSLQRKKRSFVRSLTDRRGQSYGDTILLKFSR